jgi:two-component system, OmpR family, alkaline phosphatase synthesis response regulator PhoP
LRRLTVSGIVGRLSAVVGERAAVHRSVRPCHRRVRPPPTLSPHSEVPMPTVLIVDDEQHIRLLIEQTLEELEDEGVALQTASDGEMALDVVRNHHPELVFLDVMMPKLNGFEVCRAIKEDLGLAATTVVMLTAKGQAYDREQGLAAGADRYLTKPFDPDELLDVAREALGLAGVA